MEQPYTRYEKLNEQPIYRTWQLRATGLLRQQLVEALSEEILLGQGKTLLLVDDEPQVREMIQTWLECLHYRVLTAANGKEALVVYEQHSDAIALVLTDLVMPEMGGAELCRALRQRNPRVKILVMTAYPLGEEGQALYEGRILGWLHKPCALPELAWAVCQAL